MPNGDDNENGFKTNQLAKKQIPRAAHFFF